VVSLLFLPSDVLKNVYFGAVTVESKGDNNETNELYNWMGKKETCNRTFDIKEKRARSYKTRQSTKKENLNDSATKNQIVQARRRSARFVR